MNNNNRQSNLFNIPSGISFADALAYGLLGANFENKENLARTLILLPTRRACRNLQEAFLRLTEGAPIMLPRMQPFGDIDADELSLSANGNDEINILPAIPALRRQILLARTINGLPNFSKGPAQDMALAKALGQLMDQIYTEDLNINDLPNIVDREAFSEHWQVTIDFLTILSEHWPLILAEQGLIDAADRRNQLIKGLNIHWQNNPPNHPVIAAGSTGSIPATANLLKTISSLPQGSIIFPALDTHMDDKTWDDIEEGHPQATLKNLLENLNSARTDVADWCTHHSFIKNKMDINKDRAQLASDFMIPAEKTHQWPNMNCADNALKNITRYDCKTPQEEAEIIALILRETLETPNKTAALITPDRNLARRVRAVCDKWDINLDDSAGTPLLNSNLGSYIRLAAACAVSQLKPVSLLSFLKHDLNNGADYQNFRKAVRIFDEDLCRGIAPAPNFEGWKARYNFKINNPNERKKPREECLNLLHHLENNLTNFITALSKNKNNFKQALISHLNIIENFSAKENDESLLWRGEEGEAAAIFFSELIEYADNIPNVSGSEYLEILEQFMNAITIRPKYGTHPRLMILGQLEARMIRSNRVILAGLNEGTWPDNPKHDPWMSRPMREEFGLPLPERSTGLSAHDFVQGFCANEVFLTRATRIDGSESTPSRWLQRFDTYLDAVNIDKGAIRKGPHQTYAKMLHEQYKFEPVGRPAPRPNLRPDTLYVTRIETWLKDPYAIYAGKILRLNKLDDLEKNIDAAARGNLLHDTMEKFIDEFPKDIPDNAHNRLIQISRYILESENQNSNEWNYWMPRLNRIAEWIATHEKDWRRNYNVGKSEAVGEVKFTNELQKPFTLGAKADRIDNAKLKGKAIIDYKSGGSYSISKILNGNLPQLLLEGVILQAGGFNFNQSQEKPKVAYLGYWKMTGDKQKGEVIAIEDAAKISDALDSAKAGLIKLIQEFDKPDTPYYAIPRLDNAPRFNDYEHLERVKEWAVLADNSDGEAA